MRLLNLKQRNDLREKFNEKKRIKRKGGKAQYDKKGYEKHINTSSTPIWNPRINVMATSWRRIKAREQHLQRLLKAGY